MSTDFVENVAASNYNTLYGGNNTSSLVWEGKKSNSQVLVSSRFVSPGYLNTLGIKLLQGRDFVQTDSVQSKKINVVITQSLEKLMGNNSALGKTLHWNGDTSGTVVTVVGVVNDYVYGNMYT